MTDQLALPAQIELRVDAFGIVARGFHRQPHFPGGFRDRPARAEPHGQFRLAPVVDGNRIFVPVGRMAFTNYLATSIVMSTIFYGYGLSLFAEVDRAALWLFVIGMWAAMLLWSPPWVERLGQGPFERLWRGGARMLSYSR